MDAFPAYFPLRGRTVIIAGSGDMAEAKARLFDGSPAALIRLDGEAALDPESYVGAVLAFVASENETFAQLAAAAARAAHVPVNVADRPALCDFNTPAVIDRGEVVAAVGTGGSAPLLASLLRADIEARVPEGAGWVAALLRQSQAQVRAAFPALRDRRAFLRSVLSGPAATAALQGDMETAHLLMDEAIAAGMALVGKVRFIAGDTPADDLTLRAARILAEADVLVMDEGVDPQVVRLARRDAQRLEPADAGAEALADLAHQGMQVVRLTVGEAVAEMAALRVMDVAVERVS